MTTAFTNMISTFINNNNEEKKHLPLLFCDNFKQNGQKYGKILENKIFEDKKKKIIKLHAEELKD